MREIERFGHVNIIWQLDDWGDERFRNQLEVSSPKKHGSGIMRPFSTRTPERSNPVAPTTSGIICVDYEAGTI